MLSAVYLFHFLLIIGSVGTEIRISIFSVIPKKNTHKILCSIFHPLSSLKKKKKERKKKVQNIELIMRVGIHQHQL